MNLGLHLFIHFAFSLLAGFTSWRLWRRPIVSFVAGIAGGFLIDLDHFIDYFVAFGFKLNPEYFFNGYYVLKNGKLFYFFHGWEYLLVLLVATMLVKRSMKINRYLPQGKPWTLWVSAASREVLYRFGVITRSEMISSADESFPSLRSTIKSALLALSLGMFFHLVVDTTINEGMKNEAYLMTYKAANNFKIEKIVTPEYYQKYLIKKQEIDLLGN